MQLIVFFIFRGKREINGSAGNLSQEKKEIEKLLGML